MCNYVLVNIHYGNKEDLTNSSLQLWVNEDIYLNKGDEVFCYFIEDCLRHIYDIFCKKNNVPNTQEGMVIIIGSHLIIGYTKDLLLDLVEYDCIGHMGAYFNLENSSSVNIGHIIKVCYTDNGEIQHIQTIKLWCSKKENCNGITHIPF